MGVSRAADADNGFNIPPRFGRREDAGRDDDVVVTGVDLVE